MSDLHLISFFSFEGAEIKKETCPYLLHFKVAVAAVHEEKGQALHIVELEVGSHRHQSTEGCASVVRHGGGSVMLNPQWNQQGTSPD